MLSQGLNFLPGSKLEAKDFNEKWYAARVVETDWIEREVLIHFDKWSTRFDEWIPMDSSRLRISQTHVKESKLKSFIAGEKILATWVDGKKYPAKVNAALGNDKYDILFDDGYSKILKTSKMTKLVEDKVLHFNDEHVYIGSKQERRDKKRKHTVTDLFVSTSKKKIKHLKSQICHEESLVYAENVKCGLKKLDKESNFSKLYFKDSIQQNVESKSKDDKIEDSFKIFSQSNITSEHLKKSSEEAGADYLKNDYATFVGNLRVKIEDSTYKCPKIGCNKNFRKENLLQMHIKHYHPEYSKFLGSTPNVADLAYARTIGESLDELIPKKLKNCPLQPSCSQEITSLYSPKSSLYNSEVDEEFQNKLMIEKNSNSFENFSVDQNSTSNTSQDSSFDVDYKDIKLISNSKILSSNKQPYINEILEPKNSSYNDNLMEFQSSKKKELTNLLNSHYLNDKQIDENMLKLKNQHKFNDNNYIENDTSGNICNYDDLQSKKINDVIIVNGEIIKVEKLRREEIINCTCGIIEEDGLMIQCDLCLCWQHGHCNAIEKEKDVPEKYICYICQNSHHQRTSKKYYQEQEWILDGVLPTLYLRKTLKLKKSRAALKRLQDLISQLIKTKHFLYTLRIKINVVCNKDHPKLYLWAKCWKKVFVAVSKLDIIPLVKIIKISENYVFPKTASEEKLDETSSVKSNFFSKLISSDSELMKILEEDNIQSEENKCATTNISSNLTKNSKKSEITLNNTETKTFNQDSNLSLKKTGVKHHKPKSKYITSYKYISGISAHPKRNFLQSNKKFLDLNRPIIPQPEALIDPEECKLRLLQHIEQCQVYATSLLDFIEAQLSTVGNITDEQINYCQYIQTIQMLCHDLILIKKLAAVYI